MSDLPTGTPVLCIDFDGVLHSYNSGWQGADIIPDPPVPGAIEFLKEASKHFEIHIFSSRSHQRGGMEAMQNWLWKQVTGKEYSLDETICCPVWLLKIKWPIVKPPAFLSIDDRGMTFTGTFPDPKELLKFKPWNKGSRP
jgi:hypothetical protein